MADAEHLQDDRLLIHLSSRFQKNEHQGACGSIQQGGIAQSQAFSI
jgi:hypothetical protein